MMTDNRIGSFSGDWTTYRQRLTDVVHWFTESFKMSLVYRFVSQ
jgi:hypothetical protein